MRHAEEKVTNNKNDTGNLAQSFRVKSLSQRKEGKRKNTLGARQTDIFFAGASPMEIFKLWPWVTIILPSFLQAAPGRPPCDLDVIIGLPLAVYYYARCINFGYQVIFQKPLWKENV